MLAAIIAYAVNGWFVGWQALFQVPSHLYAAGVSDYGWYVVLGCASGLPRFPITRVVLPGSRSVCSVTHSSVDQARCGRSSAWHDGPPFASGAGGWIRLDPGSDRRAAGVGATSCVGRRQDAGVVVDRRLRGIGRHLCTQPVRRRYARRGLRIHRTCPSGGLRDRWHGRSLRAVRPAFPSPPC